MKRSSDGAGGVFVLYSDTCLHNTSMCPRLGSLDGCPWRRHNELRCVHASVALNQQMR